MRGHAGQIAAAVSIACALLAMGAVLVWAPACAGSLELANGNMVPMRCAYAAKTALLLGVAIVVMCAGDLLTKGRSTVAVCLLSAALVLTTFDTVVSIGVCRSEMACWDMAFWLRLCGGVSFAAALFGTFAGKKIRRVVE